jgi:hypothetical protein
MADRNIAQSEQEVLSKPESNPSVKASDASWSPRPPQHGKPWALQPLSMDFENLGESSRTREGSSNDPPAYQCWPNRLSGSNEEMLPAQEQSKNTSNESIRSVIHHQPSISKTRTRPSVTIPEVQPIDTDVVESPLQHPAPDLQALQGAYVKNVERLERSAESMGSNVDVEVKKLREEQKRSDSRRSSMLSNALESESIPNSRHHSASYHNSIVGVNNAARNGGYSPAGISLSRGSSFSQSNRIRSVGTRLASFPEPQLEGRPLESFTSPPTSQPPVATPHRAFSYDESPPAYGSPPGSHHSYPTPQSNPPIAEEHHERPSTSASVDTFQQATTLFRDFDGVHYNDQDEVLPMPEAQTPASNPPPTRPQSYAPPPPPREGMVYYPAPVPKTLNLPQRLSKQPTAEVRDRRRSQILSSIPLESRRQSSMLPNPDETGVEGDYQAANPAPSSNGDNGRHSRQLRSSIVPPQLRASAYFEQPAPLQEVEVRHESAVATLESILDASADAPVGAFTDHPIVGKIGSEIYKKEMAKRLGRDHPIYGDQSKRQNSMLQVQLMRKSSALRLAEYEAEGDDREDSFAVMRTSGSRGRSHESESEDDGHDKALIGNEGSDEGEDADSNLPYSQEQQYYEAPTTLLAELQLRKEELKSRTRSAATDFPGGMHSTLLELDAVAQLQKNSRRTKRTTLAWEDPQEHAQSDKEAEDDDVPLGILYPERDGRGNVHTRRLDDHLPIGLVEKRELEDNEPLSSRRSRILGLPVPPLATASSQRARSLFGLEVPGSTGPPGVDRDEDGETLAHRRERLKANGAPSIGLGDRRQSSTFADEVLSQFGGLGEKHGREAERTDSPAEETLGQRKKRLQAEAVARLTGGTQASKPTMKTRHSMADGLQAPFGASAPQYPYGMAAMPNRLSSFGQLPQTPAMNGYGLMPMNQGFPNTAYGAQYGFNSPPAAMYKSQGLGPQGHNGSSAAGPGMGVRVPQQRTMSYAGPIMGFNNPSLGAGFLRQNPYLMGGNATVSREGVMMMDEGGPPLDPRQRDLIDNWRRSVMH